ncbi:CST complex subunit STN1 [Thalassophryne amazonica]|uniref:CST complex subunit STN1 n=1 Tax=Thalassophryne amazonica TaxID=390379 RepID=UPI001471462B|nr:CST complex subunit STN1 [Thalassophryne amazonica]
MQAATVNAADEPPSMLWGLDPVFKAFARLYIRDILEMKASTQVPDIYFYNSHPIFNVDVLGTVVYKREKEDFFSYGVDDGTGVINCLCWKNDLYKEEDSGPSGGKHAAGAEGSFNLLAELKKLREAHKNRSCLEIGELIRVRGTLKTTRQQREISASVYYKVNDPMMAVQIAWMMEVPQLYREYYDLPVQLDASVTSDPCLTRLSQATCLIKDFLGQSTVAKFRPYDIQDLLEPLISRKPQTTSAEQQPAAGPSLREQLHQLLQDVLQTLQDEGTVYRRVKSQDEVYHVTEQDKDLRITVKDIIREDCKIDKYMEKGCHVLHILSAVRQRHSLNVSKAALEVVLDSLECSSDIISTSDNHYTVI